MSIAQSLLPEFDHEMALTRRVLEGVPEGRNDWKPHPKSYSMEQLALHVANIPTWMGLTLTADSYDMAEPTRKRTLTTNEALLAEFDANAANAREVLAATTDETMFENWSLLKDGNEILTAPKVGIVRNFVMNHIIHHRAQLGVYLRLNDIPHPMIYGPSADSGGME